ncbi:AsmA family protein [Wenzhouxiangella marina]|uniref:AsmA domain-containing protein n=1 Tax=Wenzhouxiangella marina TaxID=1579979 RepID=A0A0K0XY80_9GAMM|nr:AsmA family protein [Wenzhouxiangella marina]AKS42625.1 hypothetical protein WM2015_2262 [Wenzhouxiangella marina]MBB6085593.1 hypothetical protein [Wenzhouxiangella marina]
MRNRIAISAALLIILLGLYGTGAILLDEARLKRLVAQHIEGDTGRRIEIRGDLRLRLFPGLRLEAEQVELSGPRERSGPALLEAELMEMQVRLLPLLRGEMDAREVRLKGAAINLHASSDGSSTLTGLLTGDSGSETRMGWLSGPIEADDVLIRLSDDLGERADSLEIEHVALEGFAPGEPMQFQFRGNVGQPPLFDELEVVGLLRPLDGGRFRLQDMHLEGSLENGHFLINMVGELDVRPGPPLSVSLEGGLLRINEHAFDASIQYTAFDRPYVNARLSSAFVDLDVARIPALLAGEDGHREASKVIEAARGMDFDLEVRADQVAQLGLVMRDLALQAQGRDQQLRVDELSAAVPGGQLTALGVFDLSDGDVASRLGFRVDADRLDELARAVPLDWLPGGSGALSMSLSTQRDAGILQTEGEGAIELWAGEWAPLEHLLPRGLVPTPGPGFDFFSARVELLQDRVRLQEFQMVREDLVVQGGLEIALPDRSLSGRLDLIGAEAVTPIGLSGSLLDPELQWPLPSEAPGQ